MKTSFSSETLKLMELQAIHRGMMGLLLELSARVLAGKVRGLGLVLMVEIVLTEVNHLEERTHFITV